MANLTANQVNVYDVYPSALNAVPMTASAEIWKGSAVSHLNGYAHALVGGEVFMGFAEQHVKDATAANGGSYIPVIRTGIIQAAITGAAVGDINKAVYMSDGNTFTYSSSSATLIGRVIRYVSSGVVMVAFSQEIQSAS